MKDDERPIANHFVLLREEFDDWAILFNPDTGRGFGLSPTGVYVWKLLDGEHVIDEMLTALRRDALDVPENVHHDVGAFIDALVAEGLAGFQTTESGPLTDVEKRAPYLEKCSSPAQGQSEAKPITYEPPQLIDFTGGRAALGDCSDHGSFGGDCKPGAGATGCCLSGGCGYSNSQCCYGDCVSSPACDCWGGNSPTSGNCADGCSPQAYTRYCRCGTCPYPGGVRTCASGFSCDTGGSA
jgi:SynChlorMet cassette protein ScmD